MPGDANQALMEFGALICRPAAPRCDECPAARTCVAFREGLQLELPKMKAKKKPTDVSLNALVVTKRNKVLLQQSTEGLFQGLWLPPMSEKDFADSKAIGDIKHQLSHRTFKIKVVRSKVISATTPGRWFAIATLKNHGIPRLGWKILEQAGLLADE